MVTSVQCFVCGESVDTHLVERFVMRDGKGNRAESVQEFAHSDCQPRVDPSTISVENDAVVIQM